MDNDDGFIKLRQAILDQALGLLDSGDVAIEDRYALSVEVAQSRGTLEAYEKAFSLAQQLENDGKLNAYLDLLGVVDAKIQENLDVQDNDQTSNEGNQDQ